MYEKLQVFSQIHRQNLAFRGNAGCMLTPCKVPPTDPNRRRQDGVRGPGGITGGVQVGNAVQPRLDHPGGNGGLQAVRARLRSACHHSEY